MIDWLSENSTWIFSGIGVAVITAIAILLKNSYTRFKEPARTYADIDPEEYPATPLPREIVEEIRDSPPYQEDDKKTNYLGLRVNWKTTFESVDKERRGRVGIMLLDRGSYPWIVCTVSSRRYPWVKLSSRGSAVRIAGEIGEIHGNSIELVNVVLGRDDE